MSTPNEYPLRNYIENKQCNKDWAHSLLSAFVENIVGNGPDGRTSGWMDGRRTDELTKGLTGGRTGGIADDWTDVRKIYL